MGMMHRHFVMMRAAEQATQKVEAESPKQMEGSATEEQVEEIEESKPVAKRKAGRQRKGA